MESSQSAVKTAPFKAMLTLYLGMISIGMGQTVVFAVLPMLGRELRLDELIFTLPFTDWSFAPREMTITTLSALSALTFSLTAPFWGRLSDRYGRKPIIIMGLLGYTVGTLTFNSVAYLGLAGLAGGALYYIFLVCARVFHAGIMSGTFPAASAYVVDVTALNERTKGMGRMGAFNQIGTMVGPALAWFVSISFLAPMYIQAAVTLLVAIMVWRYLPPTDSHTTRGSAPIKRLSYFDPRFRSFVFIGFSIFSMMGVVQQTLGFYFQDTLHLESVRSAQLFSTAMMVSSGAMLVAQFGIVQRFSGPPILLVRFGLPFAVVAYFLLANASTLPLLLVAMALFGLGMGMAGPGFNVSATLAVESHEQGALAGLLGSASGLGFVVGPILGGFLYRLNPHYPYWCAGLVLMVIILYVRRLKVPAWNRRG